MTIVFTHPDTGQPILIGAFKTSELLALYSTPGALDVVLVSLGIDDMPGAQYKATIVAAMQIVCDEIDRRIPTPTPKAEP